MSEAPGTYAMIRLLTTLDFDGEPHVVHREALKMNALWEATDRGKDPRFAVLFGRTHSDYDMQVLGSEDDLMPAVADIVSDLVMADEAVDSDARFHADAPTDADAQRLWEAYGEPARHLQRWLLSAVEDDPSGIWQLPPTPAS